MEDQYYAEVKNYIKNGQMPEEVASTRSNFIAMAKKYKVNRKGLLTRDKKPVVKISQREKIWKEMHQHSGRTPCWERIRDR